MAVKKGTSGSNKLTGTSSRDTLDGLAGNDILLGLAGADLLLGGSGNDTLDGGTGVDTLNGGLGNDVFIVDSALDKIIEASGQGTDRVTSSVSYTLAANVEQLTLSGSAAINATGNTLANLLTGNAGANRLNGGTGADSMVGGAGNDTYVVDNAGDRITDTTGIDTVEAGISYLLGATLEKLTLTGSATINGTGNSGVNVLTGNGANNRLDGGAGADTMIGGGGNDTFVVENAGDVVSDTSGTDTVESAISYTLGAAIERLTLTGTAATNGTGNALDNVLTGNSASNTLDGGAGADSLNGGSGDDTLLYDAGDASAVGGLGTDLLKVTTSGETIDLSATTALAGIERIDLGADGALVLTDAELRALSDTDALQIDGSGTAAITATGGLWTSVGTFSGYARYTLNGATLNVALAVDRTGIEQNQAPDAVADAFSTDEDAALVIDLDTDLLVNDTDPNDGHILSVTGFGDAPHGTVVDNGDGTYTYTPDANYSGADSFTYTISDGAGGTATGTVNLTVTAVNDAPTGAAAITGVPAIGQVLTAGVGTLADADGLGALSSYQWQRSADGTTGWTDITNETNATYTVDVADDTAFLRVVVGYTDDEGNPETANSGISARVTAASTGNDVLNGTAGVDLINALAGNDEVNGLAGNDTLEGAEGDDTLNGGNDDDVLNGGAGTDELNGGAGTDTADYSDRSDAVVVTLSGGEVVDGADNYFVRASADGSTLNAYRLVQTASTFADARTGAAALSFGGAAGHLVTITSSAEQQELLATLVNPNSPGTIALANPWIALSDALREGNWQWVDGPETGTTVQTPLWASGNPTEESLGAPARSAFSRVWTYSHAGTSGSQAQGSEILAFDSVNQQIWVVGTDANVASPTGRSGIDILDLSGALVHSIDLQAVGGVNSVAISNGKAAVSITALTKTDPGVVKFYNTTDFTNTGTVTVGANPDAVVFTQDGTKLLVANEGEPTNYTGAPDPEGSVSIIDASTLAAITASFNSFDSQAAALQAAGVRLLDPTKLTTSGYTPPTVSQDLEPEYITISADGTTAVVTLQEANAVAFVDIATATITSIKSLGLKDHSLAGNGLDVSDRDGTSTTVFNGNIQNWNVKGMYMPDGIASFTQGGQQFYVTANEGDSRADWAGYSDEVRVGSATIDSVLNAALIAAHGADYKTNDDKLSRLTVSTSGDLDGDGDLDELHAYGARSFSILDADGDIVFDSGDQIEQIIKAHFMPSTTSTLGVDSRWDDTRSDNKGPEIESVAIGQVGGKTLLFVGLERSSSIMVWDLTDRTAPEFLEMLQHTSDVGPEGLSFFTDGGDGYLAVSSEVSGTTTLYKTDVFAPGTALTSTAPSTSGELLTVDPDDGVGNSNLLFFAWDTSGNSYLQGLPVRLDEFLSSPTTNLSYSLSGLATQFAGSSEAYWGVIAADAVNSGAGTYLGYRLLTSTPVDYATSAADFANGSLLNGAIKNSAFFLRDFEGTASGAYPNGPWPLQLSDAADPSNAALLGLDVNGQGPVTVGTLVDGSQLFSWLGTASNNTLTGKPTFTQYGNWTLDLDTNTLTYTDATFEYAKLGPDGWFDSKADTTSWYIAEFENVSVTDGSNTAVAIVGGAVEDRLTGIENLRGGSANDRLTGDANANRLEGNGGDDLLVGAGGDDALLGGAANDELNGGAGADALTGGTGNDVFVFDSALGAGNIDSIADFEGAGAATGDLIRLDDTVFTVLNAGTLATAAFQSGTGNTATTADARVIYNTSTGALFYDADGSASGSTAVQFATLTGAPAALSAADFTVLGKPPVAGDDSRSVNEDGPLSITKASLLGNDTDPNGDTLSISGFTQPSHGVLVDTGTGYTYTPTGNYFGADSFTYTVSDGKGGTDTATVSLVINAVNDAPTGTPSSVLPTVAQDQTNYVVTRAQLIAGLSDVDGDTLSVSSISASHGTLVENPGDGSYTYTPDTAYTGADTLSFTVSDDRGGSLSTSLGLTVALPGTADYSTQTASVVVSLSGGLVTQGGNDYLVRANGTGAQQNAYLLTETASTFQQAVTGASEQSFNGVSGHLVNITSTGENSDLLAAFVTPNSPGTNALANPWIGLSDGVVEGVWRWVSGPEFNAGTTVSTSSSFWQSGNPVEAASSASTVTPATGGALLENAPNAGTGNSSFLFYAFAEDGHFYLQGLPLQMDSLIGSTTTDFRYGLSGLSTFFSTSSDVKWGVVASDYVNGGQGTYLGYRYIGSVADDVAVDTINNAAAKTAARAFLDYFNLVNGANPSGPWPLQVNDALDEAFPLADGSFGFGFGGFGPTSVGTLVDGAQLFAWQFSASSNVLGGTATAVRYGNWTLDLSTNTITYTNATTEYAKLGTSGWFDAKSTDTSWYISEFENVSLPGDAVVTESYAYIDGVKTDTLTDIDHVFGGSGADTLIGNEIANQLKGNGGADVLSGELGNDTLTGGTGDDQFWFTGALNATSNLDVIADFEGAGTAGGDVVALDDTIFMALSGTTDFTSVFQSGASDAAGGAAIRLVYNSTSGALFYDTDGDGAEAAVQFATLTGAPALAAGDFLMV